MKALHIALSLTLFLAFTSAAAEPQTTTFSIFRPCPAIDESSQNPSAEPTPTRCLVDSIPLQHVTSTPSISHQPRSQHSTLTDAIGSVSLRLRQLVKLVKRMIVDHSHDDDRHSSSNADHPPSSGDEVSADESAPKPASPAALALSATPATPDSQKNADTPTATATAEAPKDSDSATTTATKTGQVPALPKDSSESSPPATTTVGGRFANAGNDIDNAADAAGAAGASGLGAAATQQSGAAGTQTTSVEGSAAASAGGSVPSGSSKGGAAASSSGGSAPSASSETGADPTESSSDRRAAAVSSGSASSSTPQTGAAASSNNTAPATSMDNSGSSPTSSTPSSEVHMPPAIGRPSTPWFTNITASTTPAPGTIAGNATGGKMTMTTYETLTARSAIASFLEEASAVSGASNGTARLNITPAPSFNGTNLTGIGSAFVAALKHLHGHGPYRNGTHLTPRNATDAIGNYTKRIVSDFSNTIDQSGRNATASITVSAAESTPDTSSALGAAATANTAFKTTIANSTSAPPTTAFVERCYVFSTTDSTSTVCMPSTGTTEITESTYITPAASKRNTEASSECLSTVAYPFNTTVVNATTGAKIAIPGFPTGQLYLKGGFLSTSEGAVAYFDANHQLRWNRQYTVSSSVCGNGSVAIGGSAILYRCLSINFFQLFSKNVSSECSPAYISVISITAASPFSPYVDDAQAILPRQMPQSSPAESTIKPSPAGATQFEERFQERHDEDQGYSNTDFVNASPTWELLHFRDIDTSQHLSIDELRPTTSNPAIAIGLSSGELGLIAADVMSMNLYHSGKRTVPVAATGLAARDVPTSSPCVVSQISDGQLQVSLSCPVSTPISTSPCPDSPQKDEAVVNSIPSWVSTLIQVRQASRCPIVPPSPAALPSPQPSSTSVTILSVPVQLAEQDVLPDLPLPLRIQINKFASTLTTVASPPLPIATPPAPSTPPTSSTAAPTSQLQQVHPSSTSSACHDQGPANAYCAYSGSVGCVHDYDPCNGNLK